MNIAHHLGIKDIRMYQSLRSKNVALDCHYKLIQEIEVKQVAFLKSGVK